MTSAERFQFRSTCTFVFAYAVGRVSPGVIDDRRPVTVVLKQFAANILYCRRVYFKEGCFDKFFVLYKGGSRLHAQHPPFKVHILM